MEINYLNKSKSERILSMYSNADDILEKSGEGSRGGKVIGHTKSGKPIYDDPNHESHKNFTSEDHYNAADTQFRLGNKDAFREHIDKNFHLMNPDFGKKETNPTKDGSKYDEDDDSGSKSDRNMQYVANKTKNWTSDQHKTEAEKHLTKMNESKGNKGKQNFHDQMAEYHKGEADEKSK